MPVKYRRLLPVRSLSEVENPWKGVTLTRCIMLALTIVVVSSAIEVVEETLEPYFEPAEAGTEVLDADNLDESEASWWDTLAFWNWAAHDEIDEFRKKRVARLKQPGARPAPRGIRNREMPKKGLLKERE